MTQAVNDQFLGDLRRRLTQAVFRVCPGWLSSHAEDIVQTAMMRVLGAAGKRGEGEPDLSSLYVEKTAYSATVDEIRRHRRRLDVQIVTLKNNTAATNAGPISLVLDDLSENVTLSNISGYTALMLPADSVYIDIPLHSLTPGQTLTIPLVFANPDGIDVTFDIRVLAGPDSR